MPPLAITGSEEAWERLGRAIRDRRLELGLTQDQLGISKAVASNLENGKQTSYARSTLRKVSKALGWPATRIEELLKPQIEQTDGSTPNLIEIQVALERSMKGFDDVLPVLHALAGIDNPKMRTAVATIAESLTESLNEMMEVIGTAVVAGGPESPLRYLAEVRLQQQLAHVRGDLDDLRLPGVRPVEFPVVLELLEAASSGRLLEEGDEPAATRPTGVPEEPGPP